MKTALFTISIVLGVSFALKDECNCSPGYIPKTEDGKLHCVGLRNGKIISCIPSPHCKCSTGAIKVNWGKNGEICASSYLNQVKIWQCENKEDWKEFRNKLKANI